MLCVIQQYCNYNTVDYTKAEPECRNRQSYLHSIAKLCIEVCIVTKVKDTVLHSVQQPVYNNKNVNYY